MGWFTDFVLWLARWFPHLLIVRATHKAVKFRRGSRVVTCEPGIHWFWPLVTEVKNLPAVRQTTNLATQVVQCNDGQALVVSGVVVYEIRSAEAALGRSWDVDDTISDLGLTALLRALAGSTVDELTVQLKDGSLEKNLTEELRRELRRFGVYVEYAGLTDFAVARVVHLTGGSGQSVVPEEEAT